MKKIYVLLAILSFWCIDAQVINFPDANFKARLLQPNVAYDWQTENYITIDANNDGEIEVSEIQLVRELNISNANISDLTGISYFTNLDRLNCSNNLLQNIVIGNGNPYLKYLDCSHNSLQQISLDPSITLKTLLAAYNQFTGTDSIDVRYDHTYDSDFESHYPPLVDLSYNNMTSFIVTEGYDTLDCSHNPLATFNLNGASIGRLTLNSTSLSSIDGSGHLKYANFQNSQFTVLDLTNISFYNFHRGSKILVGNNPVDKIVFGESSPNNLTYTSTNTFLDLVNYKGYDSCNQDDPYEEESGNIRIIDCPNLNFFSLKNGWNYGFINCSIAASGETWTQTSLNLAITNCPNLSFICVDEGEQDHIQTKINALGLQNQVQVNSYCTFTPGGTYYTVNGTTRLDADSNGCDATDPVIPFQKFLIINGTQSQVISADNLGDYEISVGEGAHTISPILENPEYYTVSPASVTLNFPTDASPTNQQFCIAANQTHADLEVSVLPLGTARPGFDANYKIDYKNKGTHPQSGTLSFAYDDAVLDFVSANPAMNSQANNFLNWNFADLLPFETRSILVTLNVNTPMEIPPVNGGDTLSLMVSVASPLTDETPADNTSALNQTVVNSLDPNDKTCLEGNVITPEMIGKEVHYMIHFENTGTADAQNIVVTDMIDTAKFDINSLVPFDGSAPFVTRIHGNKAEFIFENINLPFDDANNDGYVAFKIKTKPALVVGDTFSNTASIYFDYNFPIVTNTATTTISALSKSDFKFENYFRIYPNPADNILNIEMKQQIQISSVCIYNTLGQLLLIVPNARKTIDVSGLRTGAYVIKVNSDKGTSNSKFLKK